MSLPLVDYNESSSDDEPGETASPALSATTPNPGSSPHPAAPTTPIQPTHASSPPRSSTTPGPSRAPQTSKRRRTATPEPDGMPAELARELRRGGHALSDVDFVDVDARATASTRVRGGTAGANASAVAARAGRIAKKAGVSRAERRKHQITALAADAAALAAARQSLGVSEVGRRKRK